MSRKKRDFIDYYSNEDHDEQDAAGVHGRLNDYYMNRNSNTKQYNKNGDLIEGFFNNHMNVKFNDPMWSKLWYIVRITLFISTYVHISSFFLIQSTNFEESARETV